jgi:hypothetical protein
LGAGHQQITKISCRLYLGRPKFNSNALPAACLSFEQMVGFLSSVIPCRFAIHSCISPLRYDKARRPKLGHIPKSKLEIPFLAVKFFGRKPLWLSTIMRYYIQPAVKRLGIKKRVTWHTFRRTYTTLLQANGEDVKVVQELLRHSSG